MSTVLQKETAQRIEPLADSELPEGWALVRAGDALKLINGFPFKPSQWKGRGMPIIRIQNLNNPGASFNYCPDRIPEKFVVKHGDLLFAWSGTPGTSFGAHIWLGDTAWLNQHIFRVEFEPRLFDKAFLRLSINRNLDEYISQAHGGVGLAHITKGRFEDSLLVLPPFTEQTHIVAKVEELLAQVNAVRARLAKVAQILKRFRQSVLAAACSGRLTQNWRVTYNPDEWEDLTLSDVIADKPKNGYSARPVKHQTPWKILTLTATTSGSFDARHFKYFDEPIAKDSPFWLRPGDILIQRGNTIEYVGVPAIYDGPPGEFIYPDLMIRLRANNRADTEFLYLALSWEETRKYLRDRATGTAGSMPKINQETLLGVPITLPSLEEQHEIVRRVDALFKLTDAIQKRVEASTKRADKLTQAILAKAFRGELVPTEAELARREGREYETAAQLLDRIKAASARGREMSGGHNRANGRGAGETTSL